MVTNDIGYNHSMITLQFVPDTAIPLVRGRLTKGEIVSFRSGMELMRMMRMIEIP